MGEDLRMWHVTVTVAGAARDPETVGEAMERLRYQHAFLISLRYGEDRAEICYWEQAPEMLDAAAMAMRVWGEHRVSADLPPWEVVGLEVLERNTFQQRDIVPGSSTSLGLASPAPVRF